MELISDRKNKSLKKCSGAQARGRSTFGLLYCKEKSLIIYNESSGSAAESTGNGILSSILPQTGDSASLDMLALVAVLAAAAIVACRSCAAAKTHNPVEKDTSVRDI